MAKKSVYYWQVPMPEWDFPVRVTERTNNAIDITTSDWSVHWHESLEFQYILSGSITFTCGGRTETLGPGDVFFANWCIPHHAVGFADGTHYHVVQVDLDWLLVEQGDLRLSRYRDILTVHSAAFSPFICQDQRLTQLFDWIIATYRDRGFGWELHIKGLLLSLLGWLLHTYYQADAEPLQTAQYDSALRYSRQVLNYIAKNYTKAINLDDIAREMGLTKSYICRLFRQHTGSTIIGYVNRLRCYQAIYLMESGASVTEAALSVGFNDYNYFSRMFKKVIGCRPSDSMTKINEDIKS